MKRVCTFVCVIMAILSMISTSAFAAVPDEKIIDLGDGFYMIETISQSFIGRSSVGKEIQGSKTGEVYSGSTLIGVATLSASFDISGSTARATAASIRGAGYNGGSYSSGNASHTSNTASGTAYFKYNGTQKTLRLSLSCTADGTFY